MEQPDSFTGDSRPPSDQMVRSCTPGWSSWYIPGRGSSLVKLAGLRFRSEHLTVNSVYPRLALLKSLIENIMLWTQ